MILVYTVVSWVVSDVSFEMVVLVWVKEPLMLEVKLAENEDVPSCKSNVGEKATVTESDLFCNVDSMVHSEGVWKS